MFSLSDGGDQRPFNRKQGLDLGCSSAGHLYSNLCFSLALGIEPKTLCIPGKCSAMCYKPSSNIHLIKMSWVIQHGSQCIGVFFQLWPLLILFALRWDVVSHKTTMVVT